MYFVEWKQDNGTYTSVSGYNWNHFPGRLDTEPDATKEMERLQKKYPTDTFRVRRFWAMVASFSFYQY